MGIGNGKLLIKWRALDDDFRTFAFFNAGEISKLRGERI
jgi:hypothetical protein